MPHLNILTVDASTKSTMQWQDVRKEALSAIAKGEKILWHLDLGLFSNLHSPISNAAQFMTLRLALDHFRDSLWEEFQRYSAGLALYKGNPDYSLEFKWDEEQENNFEAWIKETSSENNMLSKKMFCRDVCSAYISQLAENVPDRIPLFLIFDTQGMDPLLELLLTAQDLYPRFTMHFQEKKLQNPNSTLAICWPLADKKSSSHYEGLQSALLKLKQAGISYRVISENNLTVEWHGLDHLIYAPNSMSQTGIRKLHGFHAAGGTLVTVGDFLGFSQEISLEQFLSLP